MLIRKIAIATALVALSAVLAAPTVFAQSQPQDPSNQIQSENGTPVLDDFGNPVGRGGDE